jgi:hypothetical protein
MKDERIQKQGFLLYHGKVGAAGFYETKEEAEAAAWKFVENRERVFVVAATMFTTKEINASQ